jgi:8-oxo-dGTP pyrophosphatase MutT (NUDIX family)
MVHASEDLITYLSSSPSDAKMRAGRIRPIAICLCRDADRILVAEYREIGRLYYRPLGGAIEFGERGEAAVRREFREEIASDLTEVRYLGVLENIYTNDGLCSHQIVMVYNGRLTILSLYEKETIQGDELGPEKPPIYPDGLLELLNS